MDKNIIKEIRSQVASDIRLVPVNGTLRIGTPLVFDDGDHCSFFLKEQNGGWELTDRGDVLTRASYVETNLLGSAYRPRFERLMEFFGMREEAGQITMPVKDRQFSDAIFTFAQGAVEIVRLASAPADKRRKVEKRFHQKVSQIVRSVIPADRLDEHWHDPEHDPESVYPIDYRVRGGKDVWWYLFGVSTVPKCLHAAISCLHYRLAQVDFHGLAIYKDRNLLGKTATVPLDQAAEKTFSAASEEQAILAYIESEVLAA